VTIDYVSIIADEAAGIVTAYEGDRHAAVPWSDRWTVATVARHVASTHHVVGQIVRDRPDADFGLFATLEQPQKDAPEFVDWFRAGTTSLLGQLSSVPVQEECWSWYAEGRTDGWWARRMAHEAIVHRWDVEAARCKDHRIAPEVGADGVDEYLEVFVQVSRAGHNAPAGPTINFKCSDRGDQWWLDLSDQGNRIVSREPRHSDVQIRGTAERLLLFVWGRLPASAAGLDVSGDIMQMDRWSELIPPV
jgi:uncharacterized protein (TIGR03083 family)